MVTRPEDLLPVEIREVCAAIPKDGFAKIRDIIDDYPYVAVDVQHPGVHGAPPSPSGAAEQVSLAEYNYATTTANVDVLKFIQIGLTFSDEQATQPMIEPDDRRRPCAWQFNFRGSRDRRRGCGPHRAAPPQWDRLHPPRHRGSRSTTLCRAADVVLIFTG